MIRTIGYWLATALIAFVFISGGYVDITRPTYAVEGMVKLGYPVYFMVILGVWKVLGGIAILIPRTPRLKEWAYAGMLFDLTGAAASHASTRDVWWHVAAPLAILVVVYFSWALRPKKRML
jgi:uncharacterized membrane protein YphA (DoxX/SURF4 family)